MAFIKCHQLPANIKPEEMSINSAFFRIILRFVGDAGNDVCPIGFNAIFKATFIPPAGCRKKNSSCSFS